MSSPISRLVSQPDAEAQLRRLLMRPLSRREVLLAAAFVAGTLSASGLLAACGLGGSTTSKQGELLRIVIGADPGTLDPLNTYSDPAINSGYEVLEGLTTIYQTGDPTQAHPLLAESWSASPDAKTWTFKLRKGVKFHDGTPFNAQAVKANAERWLDKSIDWFDYSGIANISTTTVVDDNTVEFKLKTATGIFPNQMATYQWVILSPASMTANGNTMQKIVNLVGTGPYKFAEYTKGVHILLTRDESYRGTKPAWKQLEAKIVPSAATREAQLLSGGADIIYSPPPADIETLKSKAGYSVHTADATRRLGVYINTQDKAQPLLKDVRVRQALNYAVDKKTIISKILFGLGSVEVSPIAPLALACPASSVTFDYDPAKAKALLAAAGATGMKVRFGAPTGRYLQDFQAATAIAGYFKDVGINVEGPTTQDAGSYTARYLVPQEKADWDLFYLSSVGDYPGGYQMAYFFASGGFSYYSNSQVDALIAKGLADPNSTTANKAYCDAGEMIWQEAPNVWLWYEKGLAVSTDKVKGIHQLPNQMIVYRAIEPV